MNFIFYLVKFNKNILFFIFRDCRFSKIVEEFLQRKATPQNIVREVLWLLNNPEKIKKNLSKVSTSLGPRDAYKKTARFILDY